MKQIYVQITMWKGLVDKVQAYEEEPQVSDTSDEHWDNGVKTYNVTVEPRRGSDEDDLDPTDLTQALRNLRDGGLIPESPHPAYHLMDVTLDHIQHLEDIEHSSLT